MFWEGLRDQVACKLIRSERETVLHEYLWWISNNSTVRGDFRNNDYSDEIFIHYENILSDFSIKVPSILKPNFAYIEEHGFCEECRSCKKLLDYVDWISDKIDEVKPNIIHSSFHILMLNKQFLRDFHEKLGEFICRDKEHLHQLFPDNISETGKIKRLSSWPKWLKRGIFFRDKGVCTICRNPLSGDLFLGIDPDIDHIAPLDKYGNNDPSNLQILCNKCNNKKRNHSSKTSSYDIPLWNLLKEE